jgi:error-prone DNA polymerase
MDDPPPRLAQAARLPAASPAAPAARWRAGLRGGAGAGAPAARHGEGGDLLTLEDEFGVANVVVWQKVYETFRRAVIAGRLLRSRAGSSGNRASPM